MQYSKDNSGFVYALLIDPKYHHAATYVGSTPFLWRRWHQHLSGSIVSIPLITAALNAGCSLKLLALDVGDEHECRLLEHRYKKWKNGRKVARNMLSQGAQVLAEAWSMRADRCFDHFEQREIASTVAGEVQVQAMKISSKKRVIYEMRFNKPETEWQLIVNGRAQSGAIIPGYQPGREFIVPVRPAIATAITTATA